MKLEDATQAEHSHIIGYSRTLIQWINTIEDIDAGGGALWGHTSDQHPLDRGRLRCAMGTHTRSAPFRSRQVDELNGDTYWITLHWTEAG